MPDESQQDKIATLLGKIKAMNNFAAALIEKRRPLLPSSGIDSEHSLITATLKTFDTPPTYEYFIDICTGLVRSGDEDFAKEYGESYHALRSLWMKAKRTDLRIEDSLKMLEELEKRSNIFFAKDSEANEKISQAFFRSEDRNIRKYIH